MHVVDHVPHYVVFDTMLPFHSLLSARVSEALIQARDFENLISYGHAMSFLMHVVGHVSHYVVFYTTLPYLFIHSSQLEFQNLDIFISCRSLYRKL